VTVTGANGWSRIVTNSETLSGLAEGRYDLLARPATVGDDRYAPEYASASLYVLKGAVTNAAVTYSIATGGIDLRLAGLPPGATPTITIIGPAGFISALSRDTTLRGLKPGTYTVNSSSVTVGAEEYRSGDAVELQVAASPSAIPVSVAYTARPASTSAYNLTIDGMHVQQVVQNYAGTVPLVAGREGLLRVFVKASAANPASPSVRVRLYEGTTLMATHTIAPSGTPAPTAVDQAALGSSWNLRIPATQMVPALRVIAEVDPGDQIAESAEGDNVFPASGTPQVLDVRAVPSFDIRFVPVHQQASGLTGGVTGSNAESYLTTARNLLPLGRVNYEVRTPFTTHAPALQSNDGNGAWVQILSELNALRAAEGGGRYYAGIVRTGYSSGIAGLGYVPGRTTLTWDNPASTSEVLAHELGHNFGRLHAPCGGAGGADPAYPYSGGEIGVFGYDGATSTLKAPTMADVMGYCRSNWISDYNYTAVMNHRSTSTLQSVGRLLAGNEERPGLLIWGRVQNGEPILEPAFEVIAAPSLPANTGPDRIELLGALGERIVDFGFQAEAVADARDSTARHFAFVVPMDQLRGALPVRLRLSTHGRAVERRAASREPVSGAPEAQRQGRDGLRVRWSDPQIQGVMVRNARTGEILSFAKGGEAFLTGASSDIELTVSDGVRSTRTRVRVTGER
jgi:hypothetical protein